MKFFNRVGLPNCGFRIKPSKVVEEAHIQVQCPTQFLRAKYRNQNQDDLFMTFSFFVFCDKRTGIHSSSNARPASKGKICIRVDFSQICKSSFTRQDAYARFASIPSYLRAASRSTVRPKEVCFPSLTRPNICRDDCNFRLYFYLQ